MILYTRYPKGCSLYAQLNGFRMQKPPENPVPLRGKIDGPEERRKHKKLIPIF